LEKSFDRFELGTKLMTSADSEVRIETKEGQLAYMEALEFLRV
jgi:hypothetical protein